MLILWSNKFYETILQVHSTSQNIDSSVYLSTNFTGEDCRIRAVLNEANIEAENSKKDDKRERELPAR
jgi:hypothetical protein